MKKGKMVLLCMMMAFMLMPSFTALVASSESLGEGISTASNWPFSPGKPLSTPQTNVQPTGPIVVMPEPLPTATPTPSPRPYAQPITQIDPSQVTQPFPITNPATQPPDPATPNPTPVPPTAAPDATPAAPAATPAPTAPPPVVTKAPAQTKPKPQAKPAGGDKPRTKTGNQAEVTSFGLYFEELRPKLTEEWYMFTPLDLSQDSVLNYPLVAENASIVGSVRITVQGTQLTVECLPVDGVRLGRQFFTLFTDLDAIQTLHVDLLDSQGYDFGQPIDIPLTFGEDRKVILYVNSTADYEAGLAGITAFVPEQHRLFMQNLLSLLD